MLWTRRPSLETCLVNHQLRCVYAYVPKAACTSLKTWLMRVGGYLAIAPNVHEYLDRHSSLRTAPADEAREILLNPAYFKFTVVRNPLARLVSAYLDKIVKHKGPALRIIRHHHLRHGTLPLAETWNWLRRGSKLTSPLDLTFREFVRQVERENASSVDQHFRSQTRLLQGLKFDFVGRMENLATDFSVIQRRLGIAQPLTQQHVQSYAKTVSASCVADEPAEEFRTKTPHPAWASFYDAELLERCARIYREDFQRFGYECALPQTVERLRLHAA